MTSRDVVLSMEADGLEFGSLSERLIYLYLRYHADRKGIFRLSLTELASQLNVNRQTVIKHIDALMKASLVTRQGHGRYRIHAAPWSIRDVAKGYLDSLQDGEEFDTSKLAVLAYGEHLDWSSDDPRTDELIEYAGKLERAGWLTMDEMTAVYYKAPRRRVAAH